MKLIFMVFLILMVVKSAVQLQPIYGTLYLTLK